MQRRRSIKYLSAVYQFRLIHAKTASQSCPADPDLMVLGVFHALQGDFKGTGVGGKSSLFFQSYLPMGGLMSQSLRNFWIDDPLKKKFIESFFP